MIATWLDMVCLVRLTIENKNRMKWWINAQVNNKLIIIVELTEENTQYA